MKSPISTKALNAARDEAKKRAPEPAIEPAAAFIVYGIAGFCAVGVFIAFRWGLPTEWAWFATAAVCAFVGWLDSRLKQKDHIKAYKEAMEYYRDHPSYRD